MADPIPTNEEQGSRAIANIMSELGAFMEKAINEAYELGLRDGRVPSGEVTTSEVKE